jgi:hypothetical protein
MIGQGSVPPINTNLPRDVLGVILAHHRENVEKMVINAPVKTYGDEVPNHIATEIMRDIRVHMCSVIGCMKYDWVYKYAVFDSEKITTCDHCEEWYCYDHLYACGNEICRQCLLDIGCTECNGLCEGYTIALKNAKSCRNDTFTWECTGVASSDESE